MFKREDVWVGVFSVLLGIFVLVTASTFRESTSLDPVGPRGIPNILAWSILIIGVVHMIGGYLVPKEVESKGKWSKEFEDVKLILRLTLVSAIYLYLLGYIGYLIATPLLIIGIMWTINVRRIKSLLLTSIITTLVLFLIFGVLLKVKLPMGFLDGIL